MLGYNLENLQTLEEVRQQEAAQERLKQEVIAQNRKNTSRIWRRIFRSAQK